MERQKKVLDASVLVKWFAEEVDVDKAIKLRDQHINKEIEILMPEFSFLEISNALYNKKKNEKEIFQANTDMFNLQLDIVHLTEELMKKAINLSITYKVTIYDALYAAIAQFHGAPFITADAALAKLPNAVALEKI